MALFGTLGTSGSGMHVYRTWLDAISDNIANINTVTATDGAAFRARYITAQTSDQSPGVYVAGAVQGSAEGRLVHQPDHPLADADGNVRYPDIDLGDQMTSLLLAQRGYQANLAAFERVRDAYQQALTIGRAS
jgi:flagellar basal-body rod protein FlgC